MRPEPSILTVTQLNRQIRFWLEQDIGEVRVEGELSNVSKPASGHFYFTLKDASAQVRCVYFRNRHHHLNGQELQNGQRVLLQGTLSLYEARGDYQLIVEHLQDAGEGDLHRQFEQLKTKLNALGLFDSSRKKSIPAFPNVIGVITSSTGAALRDILTTLARRYPVAEVLIYPCEVQGKQAASQLIQAIQQANQDKRCDVLILARGGGSIEDLWAFNDEKLAQTIAAGTIPLVSGIGHETDFTIADFVADIRAATPTAAAETVTPDAFELLSFLKNVQMRMISAIQRNLQHQHLLLQHEMQKISSPKRLILSHWQTLDYLVNQLQQALQQNLVQKRHHLHLISMRLEANNPRVRWQQARLQLNQIEQMLQQQINLSLNRFKHQFTSILTTLHAVSPLATLDRGYAIATHQHHVLIDSNEVQLGDVIDIQLAKGRLSSKIIAKT